MISYCKVKPFIEKIKQILNLNHFESRWCKTFIKFSSIKSALLRTPANHYCIALSDKTFWVSQV